MKSDNYTERLAFLIESRLSATLPNEPEGHADDVPLPEHLIEDAIHMIDFVHGGMGESEYQRQFPDRYRKLLIELGILPDEEPRPIPGRHGRLL